MLSSQSSKAIAIHLGYRFVAHCAVLLSVTTAFCFLNQPRNNAIVSHRRATTLHPVRRPRRRLSFVPTATASPTKDTSADSLLLSEIQDRIGRMAVFLHAMVRCSPAENDCSHPFFYSHCYPFASTGDVQQQQQQYLPGTPPLRDLAAAWDAVSMLQFWQQQQPQQQQQQSQHPLSIKQQTVLEQAVVATCNYYLSHSVQVPAAATSNEMALCLTKASNSRTYHTIAHSSFLVLVGLGIDQLEHNNTGNASNEHVTTSVLRGLVRGVLDQQRADGAFRIPFRTASVGPPQPDETETDTEEDSLVYNGIEFYPGEAMVGLMEYYTATIVDDRDTDGAGVREEILCAMEKALSFYSAYFHSPTTPDANYSVWQVQAFCRFWNVLRQQKRQQQQQHQSSPPSSVCHSTEAAVADYVLAMCDRIVSSRSWKELARGRSFYPNLQTVEIACGLDAMAQGIRILEARRRVDGLSSHDDDDDDTLHKAHHYWLQAKNAVEYLGFVQDQIQDDAAAGYGGLGHGGVQTMEQRLDVTGHAASAFLKLHQLLQTKTE